MDKVYVGAAYYPELWDLSEVDKDIERMHAAGVNVARIGEFAWSRMEPREGEFDFSWLHEVVDKLYAAGIDSILCTPSCTPPRWLFKKYPETISIDSNDRRAEISSRCHPCKTSPVMREKNRIITEQLAKEFGSHPGVIGWQIDNEIFPYGEGCYCPLCKSAFRTYLKEKYGTPERLNKAWGMYRWSLNYDSFDDVDPPRPGQWKHPSLETEWRRFQCKQIVSYVEEQADVLHAYSKAPVGTDMMVTNLLSYYETNKKLDVIQYNHYEPAKLLPDTKFSFDFLRPILPRPFWVTETQVGWNGGNVAFFGYRPEGNCYVNTWMPIALGGEMNEYWLFRAHPQGQELGHGSLYSTPGRAYRVTEEVKHAADDFATCADFLKKSKVVSRIAMHYSSTAVGHFASAPMLEGFDYRAVASQFILRALALAGHGSDFRTCPVCGAAYGESEIVGFSGQILAPCCQKCDSEGMSLILPPNARRYLADSLDVPLPRALSFRISPLMLTRILGYLVRLYSAESGALLRSADSLIGLAEGAL